MTPAPPRRTFRSIQFLRALAALGVVYYHAVDAGGVFALPSTGAWGVDVFFVISGFIIGTVTVGNSSHFLRRRIFRVVPMYWLATLGWASAVLIFPWRANSTQVDPVGLVKSLLFIPYQMPVRDGPILQLGWTLEYEMFFYLVVAVLLWTLRDARRALTGTVILLAAIVVSGLLWPAPGYLLSFYQSPLLMEFLAGVAVSFGYRGIERRLRAAAERGTMPGWGRIAGFAFAAIVLIGALVFLVLEDQGLVPMLGTTRAISYGLPAAVIVMAALALEPLIADGRATRALLEVADASYVMYLFHPFVTVLVSQVLLGGIIPTVGVAERILLLLVTLCVVVLVSIAINRWVDASIQRALKRRFLRR